MAKLMPVSDALATICQAITPCPIENRPLSAAFGCRLEEDVIAGTHHPLSDMSAMDGYAVKAADTNSYQALEVVGESAAGRPYRGPIASGQAIRIFTGAYVPEGCDAILLQEDTTESDGKIIINSAVPEGQFIRARGQDFARDDVLIAKGDIIGARAMALAALGLQSVVKVRKKPHIAILSSGDELVPMGGIPRFGQLINSNAVFLANALKEAGAEVTDLGIVPDEEGALSQMLETPSAYDLIITTGGASVGKYDYIVSDLESGDEMSLDFWKIAMRPGKPLIFGHIGTTPLIGLPGNPVSVAICTLVFLRPVIDHMMGQSELSLKPIEAICECDLPANDQRQDYLRAIATKRDDGWHISPFARQDSAMLHRLSQANAVLIRPAFDGEITQGDKVKMALLPRGF